MVVVRLSTRKIHLYIQDLWIINCQLGKVFWSITFSFLSCRRTGRAGNKGFANTFITPEQARSAGDIIKAFELSESPVPPELAQLWENYKEEAKAVSFLVG